MSQGNPNPASVSHIRDSLKAMPIENLDLSSRVRNALLRAGLNSALDIQEAIESDSLSSTRNVGTAAMTEIEDCINKLIKSSEFGLRVNSVDSSDDIESDLPMIPSVFFNDLPIDILTEELGKDLLDRLKSAGFESLEELTNLAQIISDFFQHADSSLDKLVAYQKNILQEKIAKGRLHSQAQYHGRDIATWITLSSQDGGEQLRLLKDLTLANEVDTLTSELKLLFAEIAERDAGIYIDYFAGNSTLEQIGRKKGVTRERIRQITSKTATKLWNQVNKNPGLCLQTALLVAQDMGDQLSLTSWKQMLQKRNLIDSKKISENITPFDALCALLIGSNKAKYPPTLNIDDGLSLILESPSELSLGLIKAIESMPSAKKREVRRKISYVGGIHLAEASAMLAVPSEQTAQILKHLGFKEIISNWYTITSDDYSSRWPILNAGLTMMEVCGPLEFDVFCDGIRRYISRHYDVIAPPRVMQVHLETLGFELEDGLVCWPQTPNDHLANSDRCFIQVLNKYGPVVSFQEVVEVFQQEGYSIATATARVLPQSPIVERIEPGLYKLRGQNHSWDDVENAKNRQATIDYDPEVTYGIDGIVRYKVTIGSWALNGVISISASQQPLPDLGEGWEIMVANRLYGIAKRDDYLIWGLGGAFNALRVQIGDRVELAFDAWEKPVIRITKL